MSTYFSLKLKGQLSFVCCSAEVLLGLDLVGACILWKLDTLGQVKVSA